MTAQRAWNVRITFREQDGRTVAHTEVVGGLPAQTDAEVAAAHALRRLADQLLDAAAGEIGDFEHASSRP